MDKKTLQRILIICLPGFIFFLMTLTSCKKETDPASPEPSDNLALDSLVASKKVVETWEVISIRAYTRGENITYQWAANHGTLVTSDSVVAEYWGCSTCVGLNTIECTVSNEYGSVSDTIMINVFD